MKHSILSALFITLAAPVVLAAPRQDSGLEFPQPSPGATLKQRVGLTDFEIAYSRPSVKGRKIFGGLVPFGEVWRTGANAATKLTFSTDVGFEGQLVPAGSYALVTIPGEKEWTVILSKVTGEWGAYAYDEKNDQLRVKVKPVALPELVETMTIDLGALRDDAATLTIAWEKTRVPVKLETDLVESLKEKIATAMAGDGKKPYFQAAMFYYEHDLDLKQALAWIDEAIKEKPDAVWMVYRKGLIQAKAGDKKGALASAQAALEMAKKAGGSLGAEYTRLSESLIASVK
ncbi:MAG: DUF2911 domain-containing protein [Planctomycetota bacterium]